MAEGPLYHARSGWYFRRFDDGVAIYFAHPGGHPKGPDEDGADFTVYLEPEEWASVVAHVSARGGNAETFAAARALHDRKENSTHA